MSPLERLQLDIEGRLKSSPYFADKPVIVWRPREKLTALEIETRVNNALAGLLKQGGRSGVALSVFMPLCDVPQSDMKEVVFDVSATIRAAERPMVNMGAQGTRCSAEEVCFEAAALLHDFMWGYSRQTDRLALAKDALTPRGAIDELGTTLAIDLKFTARIFLSGRARVALPEIGGTASAVELASATPGAAIYYTLDGSFPRASLAEESALGAENPNSSELYAGPFAVEPGTLVRACACLAGAMPSNLAQRLFP